LDDLAALHARDQAVEVADRLPVVGGVLARRELVVELNHGGLSLSSCGFAGSARGQAGVDADLDLVGDLQGPEQRGVRLDAPVGLLEANAAGQAAGVA